MTDIGVGLDGTVILSTVSGHVYIGTKKKVDSTSSSVLGTGGGGRKSTNGPGSGSSTPVNGMSSNSNQRNNSYKFNRVPYLQRCVKVAANSTGAFSAIRSDVPLRHIDVEGPTLAENLLSILPHWRRVGPLGSKSGSRRKRAPTEEDEEGEEEAEYDARIERDVEIAGRFLRLLGEWEKDPGAWEAPMAGSDTVVEAKGGKRFPVHRLLLLARCPVFATLLKEDADSFIRLDCDPLTVLLLLHYLYSDDFPTIWDSRILQPLRSQFPSLMKDISHVKSELRAIAATYQLEALSRALDSHIKSPPAPTLSHDLQLLLPSNLSTSDNFPSLDGDIVLQLSDLEVRCHSVVLRARCSFFETFYDDEDWTLLRKRGDAGATEPLLFNLKHLHSNVMELVLKHIYYDAGVEVFDLIGEDFVLSLSSAPVDIELIFLRCIDRSTSDEYIDFVILVLAAANELLLDKLKLVCSSILRRFSTSPPASLVQSTARLTPFLYFFEVTLRNVCSILVEAAFYEANDLVRTCFEFLASSMETVLEGRLLDDLPPDLISSLSTFVQERQGARMPISRSGMLVDDLMIKHKSWLAEQDIAIQSGGAKKWRPSMLNSRSPGPSPNLLSPGPSPQLRPTRSPRIAPRDSPNTSPALQPLRESNEPFPMDEDFSLDGISPQSRSPVIGANAPYRIPMPKNSSGKSRLNSPTTASFTPLGSPPPSRLQPWSKSIPDVSQ